MKLSARSARFSQVRLASFFRAYRLVSHIFAQRSILPQNSPQSGAEASPEVIHS